MIMKMEVNMKKKISMGKKKRWIEVCVVGVIVCAGIFSFIKLRNGKKTVNAGNMKQTTVSLSKMDFVESVSATGALDSETGRHIMDLFHHLHRETGKTIVLITHSQELARETERIITIKDGSIIDTKGV